MTAHRELTVRRGARALPKAKIQYLLLPYAQLRVTAGGRELDRFQLGGYSLWKDTEENWKSHLGIDRPGRHLAQYVDRKGRPLTSIWVATPGEQKTAGYDDWQRLVAALYYLGWARAAYGDCLRPAADDFYFETFEVPEGGTADSPSHVRYSKYAANYWSDLAIHPSPDVSMSGTNLVVAGGTVLGGVNLEQTAIDLFQALDPELRKAQSSILASLWFFLQARFCSGSRSSYAEDVQNMCTAFEALLDVRKKGDSAKQVSDGLTAVFTPLAPNAVDKLEGRSSSSEAADVLDQLKQWVLALYEVRNAYTHGKPVVDYVFCGRSIWQDSFEVFRLAANRVILQRPERRSLHGSELAKLLMSEVYLDELIREFRHGRELFRAQQSDPQVRRKIRTLLDRAWVVDPERVVAIYGLRQFRQALYGLTCLLYLGLKDASNSDQRVAAGCRDLVSGLEAAYQTTESEKLQGGSFDVWAYLRRVAPLISSSHSLMPVFGAPTGQAASKDTYMLDFAQAFKMMYGLYVDFQSEPPGG